MSKISFIYMSTGALSWLNANLRFVLYIKRTRSMTINHMAFMPYKMPVYLNMGLFEMVKIFYAEARCFLDKKFRNYQIKVLSRRIVIFFWRYSCSQFLKKSVKFINYILRRKINDEYKYAICLCIQLLHLLNH